MGAAVLPFLGYLVLQLAVMVLGLNIVRDREIGVSGVLKSWIFGQMLCFAVLQVMAVPMILMRWKFDVLFWSYLSVMAVVFGLGVWRLAKGNTRIKIGKRQLSPFALLLLMVTALLILWQSSTYFFGIHLDEDDARWLAEANDAIEYGDMMWRSFFTGELIDRPFMIEDVSSPWPMMYSVMSRALHIRVSIFAHTIYPPVAIIMMYVIYWLIGLELFKKSEARLAFLFCATILILYYGGEVYSQGVFSLIRIWQGKASVAAVVVPIHLYLFIRLNKESRITDWIAVVIVSFAACLMSGMGIFLSALMIGVYGVYNIIAYQNWKRIPLWCCSLLPSAASYIAHIIVRGG